MNKNWLAQLQSESFKCDELWMYSSALNPIISRKFSLIYLTILKFKWFKFRFLIKCYNHDGYEYIPDLTKPHWLTSTRLGSPQYIIPIDFIIIGKISKLTFFVSSVFENRQIHQHPNDCLLHNISFCIKNDGVSLIKRNLWFILI